MKVKQRMRAFFLSFAIKGKRINRVIEIIVRGVWGTQSCNMPDIILHKDK
jgi:hypothetical protein